jgi:hypothetical protein
MEIAYSCKLELPGVAQVNDAAKLQPVLKWTQIAVCVSRVVKNTPHLESASELYRPSSDRLLSAKLVPTFTDKGCHVVSMTDPYCSILGFLDRSRYYFFQVAP